jgi:hypothetical protein
MTPGITAGIIIGIRKIVINRPELNMDAVSLTDASGERNEEEGQHGAVDD